MLPPGETVRLSHPRCILKRYDTCHRVLNDQTEETLTETSFSLQLKQNGRRYLESPSEVHRCFSMDFQMVGKMFR